MPKQAFVEDVHRIHNVQNHRVTTQELPASAPHTAALQANVWLLERPLEIEFATLLLVSVEPKRHAPKTLTVEQKPHVANQAAHFVSFTPQLVTIKPALKAPSTSPTTHAQAQALANHKSAPKTPIVANPLVTILLQVTALAHCLSAKKASVNKPTHAWQENAITAQDSAKRQLVNPTQIAVSPDVHRLAWIVNRISQSVKTAVALPTSRHNQKQLAITELVFVHLAKSVKKQESAASCHVVNPVSVVYKPPQHANKTLVTSKPHTLQVAPAIPKQVSVQSPNHAKPPQIVVKQAVMSMEPPAADNIGVV